MITIEQISGDLESLGVQKGDVLLVRADLGSMGKLATKKREGYLNAIINAVGDEGTVVGLSFTEGFFGKRNSNKVFNERSKAYTGAFANLMLKHPDSVRSQHPTNSFVAIGKHAEFITREHNETSGAYDPVRKILELNGKMILIGCAKTSPGFTTTHLAEVELGYHRKIIFPKLNGIYYERDNEVKLFLRRDLGSCSSTFYKMYGHYVKEAALMQNYIGEAYSIMIDAKAAYEIDIAALQNNPKMTLCDDKHCLLCRARRWDNLKDIPGYILRRLAK